MPRIALQKNWSLQGMWFNMRKMFFWKFVFCMYTSESCGAACRGGKQYISIWICASSKSLSFGKWLPWIGSTREVLLPSSDNVVIVLEIDCILGKSLNWFISRFMLAILIHNKKYESPMDNILFQDKSNILKVDFRWTIDGALVSWLCEISSQLRVSRPLNAISWISKMLLLDSHKFFKK